MLTLNTALWSLSMALFSCLLAAVDSFCKDVAASFRRCVCSVMSCDIETIFFQNCVQFSLYSPCTQAFSPLVPRPSHRSFPGLLTPRSQAFSPLVPRPSHPSFPGLLTPRSQAFSPLVPRPSHPSFPGLLTPRSQAFSPLVPRPSHPSFPGLLTACSQKAWERGPGYKGWEGLETRGEKAWERGVRRPGNEGLGTRGEKVWNEGWEGLGTRGEKAWVQGYILLEVLYLACVLMPNATSWLQSLVIPSCSPLLQRSWLRGRKATTPSSGGSSLPGPLVMKVIVLVASLPCHLLLCY